MAEKGPRVVEPDDRRRAFEEAWPSVEAKLRRVLAARRVPESDHDDYLQDVATRALSSKVMFNGADDLLPWASTVLRRLHVDSVRKDSRIASPSRIGDVDGGDGEGAVAATGDIALEVVARMDLDVVAKVMATWSPDAREVLLSSESPNPRYANAFYVRRHRLRMKLLAALDGLGALWGNIWRRADLGPQFDQLLNSLVAPMAAACAMAFVFGPFVAHSGSDAVRLDERPAEERRLTRGALASIAGSSTDDATARSTEDLPRARIDRGTPPVGGPPGAPRGAYALPHVVERQEVRTEAAGYDPSVGVEQEDGPQPITCYWDNPVLGDGCVGEPELFSDLPPVRP